MGRQLKFSRLHFAVLIRDFFIDLPGVKATCYVCMVNERDQLIVWSTFEVSVSFAEVDVDLYWVLDYWHAEYVSPFSCAECPGV